MVFCAQISRCRIQGWCNCSRLYFHPSICLLAGYKGRIQQTKNGQNSLIVELGSPLMLFRFSDTLVTGMRKYTAFKFKRVFPCACPARISLSLMMRQNCGFCNCITHFPLNLKICCSNLNISMFPFLCQKP